MGFNDVVQAIIWVPPSLFYRSIKNVHWISPIEQLFFKRPLTKGDVFVGCRTRELMNFNRERVIIWKKFSRGWMMIMGLISWLHIWHQFLKNCNHHSPQHTCAENRTNILSGVVVQFAITIFRKSTVLSRVYQASLFEKVPSRSSQYPSSILFGLIPSKFVRSIFLKKFLCSEHR